MKHESPYKPEVNYDMTKRPPAPIMDSEVVTKAHDWLPGWIRKYWNLPDEKGNNRPSFKPGKGYIRRPDVVIVNDPGKPPTQENIKQVIEIKFPPDTASSDQIVDYKRIAGGDDKLIVMEPKDCDCDQSDPTPPKIPVEQIGVAGSALALLYMLVTKRPPPVPAY
jgi:hypothetical protein